TIGQQLGATVCTNLAELPRNADLYILAVSDAGIAPLASRLKPYLATDVLVVHTSGATPASVLAPYFSHYGVFYPLQTFSRSREVEMQQVPFCLWAKESSDYTLLEAIARQLSKTVVEVDDAQRQYLHLAAVFVNNFTNYLQHISQTILAEQQLPEHLLRPLLRETIAKLDTLSAVEAQTGPARRADTATIQRHLALLQDRPQWAALYRLFSEQIAQHMNS
ncbi:MAG: DUF2520 domain-containing protein, partial [Bacteroidetes bacterium]